MHPIPERARSRRLAVSALAAAITLTLGHAHAQSVEAQSTNITGRAPVVTIGSVTNQTIPGQAPAVGHVLHAEASATDPDNDAITAITFRWKRGATEVGTGADYATTLDDAGQTLTLDVEATTDAAITEPASGSATNAIAILANTRPTATPTITGTIAVGSTLIGTPGFADADNDIEGTHTYQWYRADDANRTNQAAIEGATGTSHAITAADVGKFIVLGVIPRTTTGNPNEGVEAFAVAAGNVDGTAPIANNPTVSGELKTGSELTANFDYEDDQNDPQGEHKYQWYHDDGTNQTNIANATGKTYILKGTDQGDHSIGVRITPVSTIAPTDGAPVEARTAAKFIGTAPTAAPTLSGTLRVGQQLTANAGYQDVDNDPERIADGTTYRWCLYESDVVELCESPQASNVFTLQASHIGKRVRVKVTPESQPSMNARGVEHASDLTAVITESAPTATPTITFDGTLDVGTVLTGNPGFADAENDPEGTHSYQWYRADDAGRTNQVAIDGATNATYTVTSADQGKFLVLGVIPRATAGTPTQGNEGFAVTASAVPVTTAPEAQAASVTGELKTGSKLRANFSYFDKENDPEGEHKYQWYRDEQGVLTDIAHATGKEYVLTGDDQGDRYIGVRITPVSTVAPTDGTPVEVRSELRFIGNAPMAHPTLSGTTAVDSTLQGHVAFEDVDNDVEGTHVYQWYRADDASRTNQVAIADATATSYKIVPEDLGKFLVFGVKARTTAGNPNESIAEEFAVTEQAVGNSAPTAALSVTGTIRVGQLITAVVDHDDRDGDAEGEHEYRWYRSEDPSGVSGRVELATTPTYRIVHNDRYKWLVLEVVPKSVTGSPVGATQTFVVETQVPAPLYHMAPEMFTDHYLAVGGIYKQIAGEAWVEGTGLTTSTVTYVARDSRHLAHLRTPKLWLMHQGWDLMQITTFDLFQSPRQVTFLFPPRPLDGEWELDVEQWGMGAESEVWDVEAFFD